MQVKETVGNKVTFEDPARVRARQRTATRAALVAKKAQGALTVEDLHSMLELILDAQDDLLRKGS